MRASGSSQYNILQNNGAAAHQAVFHVHFHIIPRTSNAGLGIGWQPGKLASNEASELLAKLHDALSQDSA
jgi:histidine triad (HIT) family protein